MNHIAIAILFAALLPLQAHAAKITLNANGVSLAADQTGQGDHGVVLIHAFHANRADWGDLAKAFESQGGTIVSVDLRGHGESKGEIEPEKMTADVKAAIDVLKKKGVKRITLMGVGLGGNLAFAAAAADPTIADVVMITPRLDHNGVKVSSSLKGFGRRPLLLISGSDDQLSIKASTMLSERIDSSVVEILSAEGAGMKLLNRDSSIQGILVSWFNGAYKVASQEASHNLETGTGTGVKTTGKKLGEL